MDRYPTMQRNSQRHEVADANNVNDIFEWFTEKELSVIYRQGYLCKLFQYNEHSRRWQLSPTFLDILPTITMRGYSYMTIANISEEPQQINITHPVYDMIERLRLQGNISIKNRLILALSVMMHTDVGDMKFNYYIRKVAYQIIVASNVYKRTCVKARIRREVEEQLLSQAREQARLERMAQREIEMEQERIRIQTERELERQRIAAERLDLIRLRQEEKQLREQQREHARLEKQAQEVAKAQEREAKVQQKLVAQREKEENRARRAEDKVALKLEKEDTQRNKLATKMEKENILRERIEQKNIQKQAKLDKKQNKDNETKRKALAMSAKKEKIKQIQQQKLYDQSLTYVCKLFKTIK
jgi:DNA repair exonuclease SbcCD ATPase subunit